MISRFSICDFKSYRKANLPLAHLTLLLGPNASGKSNAIEAIRLLSWLARGRRLDDIFREVDQGELRVRGRPSDLFRADLKRMTLGCMSWLKRRGLELKVNPGLSQGELRIVGEVLREDGENLALYEIIESAQGMSHDVGVQYNNFARGGKKPKVTCTDTQAVFTQLQSPAVFARHHTQSQSRIPSATRQVREDLERILFLDPDPRRMRGYSFLVDDALAPDGSNVSSVLSSLVEAGHRDAILDFIWTLPEQDILDLQFLRGPRNEVMVQLVESFGGRFETRDAPLLSDGTLRVLAIAAALYSAPESSLVIIEELDNGIHPSRARDLLARMLAVAKARQLRILLTSHNPALADALPDEALRSVVFCYRDPVEGHSCLVQLGDLARFPELMAQGTLGQLMTRGLIERYAKDPTTPEQRSEAALAWLEKMSGDSP